MRGRERERGEERRGRSGGGRERVTGRRRTGEGDRPASACAPPPLRTLAERQDEREREKEGEEGERERKEEREVRRLTGERVISRRRRGRARPGGWRRLDPLLDWELRRGWGSGAMHGRLHSASSSWCGGRRLMRSCGRRRPQRMGDDTCSWCSTHGFRHSSKRSGQIRPRPMVEKTGYRDEPLEHAFMGCSRARCRSSPEGRKAGRRGGEERCMRGACTRSSRRVSLRCSSGCSLPTLGLRVQRRPHHPLLPLAHRPVRVQRSNAPHCLPSIFRYIQGLSSPHGSCVVD